MTKYQNKPLSPHLTIYRPQITSIMSISHRITGVVLFVSTILASWIVASLVYCKANEDLEIIREIMEHNWVALSLKFIGIIVSFCLYYHLLNGIRHLYWDAGKGFELKSVYRSGYLVIAGAIILTAITVFFVNYF